MDKLSNGWKVAKIKSVVQKTETYNPQNSQDSIFNYIDIGSIDNSAFKLTQPKEILGKDAPSRARKRVKKGDVIFATTRPNLKNIAQIEIDYYNSVASTGFCILRPISEIDSKFLFYFLLTENIQNQIAPFIRGAQYPAISDNDLYSCSIPLPPLSEQINLVSKLDVLFARIDKSIYLLEENIKHTKGLMASVLEELFEKLKAESTIYKIKEIAEIKGGKRLPKGESIQDEKTDYPYIRVTDFTDDGTIDVNSVKYMNKSVQEQIKRYIITSKDLYISIAGTIGKTGIIPKELENANLTENAARLVFKPNIKINNRFVYYFTLSDNFKDQVGLATKTVAQPKLALTRLAEVELPIPSIEVQNKEVQIFDELSRKFQEINNQQLSKLAYLKALKSSLLDRAFKGEL